jgi:putative PEP-CTERM system TPR-repeat lipoprotein
MRIFVRQVFGISLFTATLLLGCSSDTPQSLLASAKAYLAKNDSKAAIIQLKSALQKDQNLAEARFLLGAALLESGDPVSAEKELRKAWELKYSADQVVPPLTRSLALLGQYKQLNEFANIQLSSQQSKAEVQTAIGEAQFALGNVNAARDAFARALDAQPKYVPALVGHARIAARSGDFAKALQLVDAALPLMPAYHPGWLLKGDILVAQAEQERALAAYHKAVEVKPDFIAGHWALVSLLIEQKKMDDAAKHLLAMKKVAPSHPQTLYLQALLAYHQKNYTVARDAIQQQLRVFPDYMPGLVLAGAIELELESYAHVEAHIYKVLQQAPAHNPARRILILSYLRGGQPIKALEMLQPVLNKIDNDANMLALAGEVYMANGQPGQASRYFSKASALDPGDVRKRTAVAATHMAGGEMDRAFRELEQAAAIDSSVRADMALVAVFLQQRNYDRALAAIGKLEKKMPASPLPHNLRGTALLGKNDRTAARQSFERALELNPAYFPAASSLAAMDLADDKSEAARQRYDRLLAKDPQNLQALLALAALRSRSGASPDEVTGIVRKAIAAHPREPQPRIALIGYYVGGNNLKKAVAAAQEAVAAFPDNADILDAAGRTHQAAGETNQALSVYNRLASIRPSSVQPYLRMAEVQRVAKDTEGALESLRRALSMQPDSIEAQRLTIAVYVDAGRQKDAVAVAREIQRQRPRQSVGYSFEGDIHAAQKNVREAAAAYRAGLERVKATDLAVKLYSALRSAGDAAAAEQFAATWLKDNPKDGAFRMQLAQAANAANDFKNAAHQYRKLLEADPNDAVVLNNLAWAEAQMKDPKALEHAEKANKLAPNQPVILDTLGMLLVESGDSARGVQMLQKASAMAPRSASIRLNLAKALIKVGQKDAARKELDELAKLGDKFSGHVEVSELKRSL